MTGQRSLPWTDLVAAIGVERFEQLKGALAAASVDPQDRDRFLMNAAAGQLLRDLMPEDAPPAAVTAWAALLHMLYLGWNAGWPVKAVTEDDVRQSLALSRSPTFPPIIYLQLPERLVWAEPESGQPHEPLDGLFVAGTGDRVRVLAILGFHALREGFTTMEAESATPVAAPGERADGTPAFASALPGGDRARLVSVTTPEELLGLAARLPLDVSG